MIILGLVGTPASGKSTVAQYLASRGAVWLNADLIARDCLQSKFVRPQLVDQFGTTILDGDQINRSRLAELVFGDEDHHVAALRRLESIVHPPTHARILELLGQSAAAGEPITVLDVPLLFESSWHLACDAVICVDANRARRQQWAKQRRWKPDELQRRESRQLPIAEKQRRSNWSVRNDKSLDRLHRSVHRILSTWLGGTDAISGSDSSNGPAAAVSGVVPGVIVWPPTSSRLACIPATVTT